MVRLVVFRLAAVVVGVSPQEQGGDVDGHPGDVGGHRHPVAATVLGLLRRATQAEAREWIRRQPRASDRTFPTFFAKMNHRLGTVIRLITRAIQL